MKFLKCCCGKDSVRVVEPKSNSSFASDRRSKTENAEESARSKEHSRTKRGGFVGAYNRFKKWTIKHLVFWKKQKTNEERDHSNSNVSGIRCRNAYASAEVSEATEDVAGTSASKDCTADATESEEKIATIEKGSTADSSYSEETSEASSSTSTLNESDSKNWVVKLSETNIDNIFSSMSVPANDTLTTEYVLTTEPEAESEFSMGSQIGKGSFGSVHKGQWTLRKSNGEVTTKDVAIKIIECKNLKQFSFTVNEMKAFTRCKHRNIVELNFIKISGLTIYLGLELASRGDLRDYLEEEGPLLENQAGILFHQIVDAVQYCHVNGIAHLDIKSQNILLDENLNVKVTDFGLSLVQPNPSEIKAQQFKTNVGCGTLPYTAPETFSSNTYDSRKCDVWSLGVLLFMMLTCRYPFSICDIELMVERLDQMEEFDGHKFLRLIKRVYERPRFPPGLSKGVRGLVVTMLRIKPKYRTNISKILHHYYWRPESKRSN